MFAPIYAGSRAKQPVTFLASLGLQCTLVALLCLVPPPHSHKCCLRKDDPHAAQTMPLYFEPPVQVATVAKPVPNVTKSSGAPALPSSAKALKSEALPVEAKLAQPETKPEESSTAAATDAPANANGEAAGVAPFPGWQMSSNENHLGLHHQVKEAMPVFTPEPPILHSEFPEPARGKEVVMKVIINEEGSIVAVSVLQGIGYGVEQSIVETLKRWIYVPAKFNGVAIATQKELRFQFPG